jgi:hypothetical protein
MSRRIARILTLLACGCGAPPVEGEQPVECPAFGPLFGATTLLPIGMSEREADAIVHVSLATGDVSCTGVVISAGLVLTAGHCVEGAEEGLVVRVGRDASTPRAVLAVSNVDRPSASDLALLTLEPDLPLEHDVSSIPVALAPFPLRRDGQLAVAAGYGVTESLAWGERRFAFSTVTEGADGRIVTRATGASGACIGDSGGPLLWRDEAGRLRVFGILSDGDASCRGSDHFVDVVGQGLPAGDAITADGDCQGLDATGACFAAELAAWCDGTSLKVARCERGTGCGYRANVGYRCVVAEQARCKGYDSWGACEEDRAVRCDEGLLVSSSCSCGGCVRSAISGRVGCQP